MLLVLLGLYCFEVLSTPGNPVRPDYRWANPEAVDKWHGIFSIACLFHYAIPLSGSLVFAIYSNTSTACIILILLKIASSHLNCFVFVGM